MSPLMEGGSLVVDCSTTGPEVSQDVARELRSRSVDFLDAPVTGGPVRAASGTLTSMVGGDEASFKRATPILQSFSSKVLYMGTTGNGQLAKALNNCLYNVSVAAMAEMLPLASRAGLSLESFVEVVTTGTGQSFGFNQWAPHVLRREFEAHHGYPMDAAFKDFETLAAVVKCLGVEAPPVARAARSTYERALAMGLGGQHKGAMVKVWEEHLGLECTPHEVNLGDK